MNRLFAAAFVALVLVATSSSASIISAKHHIGALNEILVRQGVDITKTNPETDPVYHTFEQQLDHFDAQENTTWAQRYLVNETYFGGPGSPVFCKFRAFLCGRMRVCVRACVCVCLCVLVCVSLALRLCV
jgi:hypothetical protein